MPFDLSESFILEAERQLGARFPGSYKAAMSRSNGGEIQTDDDVWQLHPIADASDMKRLARTANHIIRETVSAGSWQKFPVDALAIGTNGSGDRLILLRRGDAFGPEVHVWRHETGNTPVLVQDFSEFRFT